ncbi:hypothetical protein BS47DRAFT_681719 [Hydnum rufescens UP504]|uniref:SprT-like domain-containing protein n=1 Tax=Hydnum rufescens UP504 TaxID=1448309 RepID=A0A9P6DYW3_9AGAM|nr:hypothetical protein BS47DRAFT_681719 [Hydnum rufescens UP504]
MAYALELYHSLNVQVFGNRLPHGYSAHDQGDEAVREMCEIVWSKTLTTTAGRAITKRGEGLLPDGQHRRKIMIELATKVVDSDERVRHTLSHEMCHLAVWLIDQGKDGGHGRAFKAWAARVMKVRRDIEITSTHAYQITYKFEWKCKSCGQVYVYGFSLRSIFLLDILLLDA